MESDFPSTLKIAEVENFLILSCVLPCVVELLSVEDVLAIGHFDLL